MKKLIIAALLLSATSAHAMTEGQAWGEKNAEMNQTAVASHAYMGGSSYFGGDEGTRAEFNEAGRIAAQVRADERAGAAMQLAQTAALTPSKPAATINVAARTLGNQPVQTPAGVVLASSLPAETQVAVPHVPALIQEAHASHNGSTAHGSTEHGSGRGADNAHDHAFR